MLYEPSASERARMLTAWTAPVLAFAILLSVRPCVAQTKSAFQSLVSEMQKARDVAVAQEAAGDYPAAAREWGRVEADAERLAEMGRGLHADLATMAMIEKIASAAGQQIVRDRARTSPDGGLQRADAAYDAGLAFARAQDWRSALSAGERALSMYRRLGRPIDREVGEAAAQHLLGIAAMNIGDTESATVHLNQALVIVQRLITVQHLAMTKQEADVLSDLGNIAQNLEEYPRARRLFEKALAIRRQVGTANEVATLLFNLGRMASYTSDYTSASNYYLEALETYRHLGLQAEEARTILEVGTLSSHVGNYEGAMDSYKNALAAFRSLGLSRDEATVLGDLGATASLVGDYGQATDYCEQALTACRHLGQLEGEAGQLQNLGNIAAALGDYGRATNNLEQAVATFRALKLPKEEASNLLSLGELAFGRSDYSRAMHYFARAQEIYRRLRLPEDARQAALYVADALLESGRMHEAFGVYHAQRADLERLGRYYLFAGDPAVAVGYFRSALAIARKASVTPVASEIAPLLIGLGLSEERMARYPESVAHLREAVQVMEDERSTAPLVTRTRFLDGHEAGFRRIVAYEGLVRCLKHLGRAEDAFAAAEHTKARASTEAVAGMARGSGFGIPTALRAQETELAGRMAATQSRTMPTAGDPEMTMELAKRPAALRRIREALQKRDKLLRDRLEAELASLRKDQEALIERLRREYPEYAAMQYPQPMRASELALHPDEVLLEYEVTDTETLAFVVKGGKVTKSWTVPLTRKALEDKVHQFRRSMETIGRTSGREGWRDFDPALAHELYGLLLEPMLRLLSPREHLLVVPDGVLCLLPLEALVVDPPPATLQWVARPHQPGKYNGEYPLGLHYVGDDRVLTYWQSGTSLTVTRHLRKEVPNNSRILVVADPIYEKTDERLIGASPTTWQAPGNVVAIRGVDDDTFRRTLADSSTVVQAHIGPSLRQNDLRLADTGAFAERLHSAVNADILTGVDACESRVLATPLDRYGMAVLFAMHGTVDERTPYLQQATLLLSRPEAIGEPMRVKIGNGPERTIDGYLTMSKIMDLHFRCELGGALACQTGEGDQVRGEGTMNLGRAFQYAGCRSTLISLFSVSGQPTNKLSESLLSDMRDGVAKDDAILAARRKLREAGYGHPLDWASFILMGERDVVIKEPFRERYAGLVRACAALVTLLVLWLLLRLLTGWISSRRTAAARVREEAESRRRDTFSWMRDKRQ